MVRGQILLLGLLCSCWVVCAFIPPYAARPHPYKHSACARQNDKGGTLPAAAAAAAVDGSSTAEKESWFERFKGEQTTEGGKSPVLITLPNQQSIAQVLAETFAQVLDAEKEGVPRVLMFPNAERLYDGATMAQLVDHLDLCKDCCEVLGVSQNTVGLGPHTPDTTSSSFAPVPSIYIKPMQSGGYDFEPDPYWDDDEDDSSSSAAMDFGAEDDEDDEYGGLVGSGLYHVPEGDEEIIGGMKTWVGAVIADLGVCPFTVDAERAGLPVGGIRYEITRESSPEAIYSKYWEEVSLLSGGGSNLPTEKELSTTLLITPKFGLTNREYFESFSNTLTQPLEALQLEEDIQLVFFHPDWVFRDGADRMGSDSAANFARRSPWPMINILRTPQVRKAQKAIPTGLVYRQNEVTLDKIGFDKLQGWLEERDWGEVKNNYRVDRRTVPILSTAQDLIHGRTPDTPADEIQVTMPQPTTAGADDDGYDEPVPVLEEASPQAAVEKPPRLVSLFDQDDEDDDWSKPFDSRAMVEVGDDDDDDDEPMATPKRSRDEVIKDCLEIIKLLRKRANQDSTLTPHEIKQLESLVKGVVQ